MKAQVERADLPGSLSHWPRPSSEATEKGLCVSSGVGRVGSSMQPVVRPEKSHRVSTRSQIPLCCKCLPPVRFIFRSLSVLNFFIYSCLSWNHTILPCYSRVLCFSLWYYAFLVFKTRLWYWVLGMVWHTYNLSSMFITNYLAPFIELSLLTLWISNATCHMWSLFMVDSVSRLTISFLWSWVFFWANTTLFNYYCFVIGIGI